MPSNNFLHLMAADLDKPVYRIMSLKRLIECLVVKKLTLLKPKKWDDPFENWLLSATVEAASGELGTMQPIRNAVFGLCWTLHRETGAMWRIYSPKSDGVRVKSTPRKLLNALKAANPTYGDVTCFIGRVKYHDKKALIRALHRIRLMSGDGSGIAESLLHKRREFAHEKEVRLIHNSDNAALVARSDVYQFPINPNNLFEQAIFDPRMDRAKYLKAESKLRRSGYNNKIGQSVLYRPPTGLIIKL